MYQSCPVHYDITWFIWLAARFIDSKSSVRMYFSSITALEFYVSDDDSKPLPTHVKYSIRMDTSKVDKTTAIQDK